MPARLAVLPRPLSCSETARGVRRRGMAANTTAFSRLSASVNAAVTLSSRTLRSLEDWRDRTPQED